MAWMKDKICVNCERPIGYWHSFRQSKEGVEHVDCSLPVLDIDKKVFSPGLEDEPGKNHKITL